MHLDQTVTPMESKVEDGQGKTYGRRRAVNAQLSGSRSSDVHQHEAGEANNHRTLSSSNDLLIEDVAKLTASSSKMQPHPLPETESETEAIEDDVKVCDICGDAGLEELLAFCCRCSDGAEHTYCMRNKLDELPEGDWLCEECKLSEEIRDKECKLNEEVRDKDCKLNEEVRNKDCKLNEETINKEVDKSGELSRAPEETINREVDKSGELSRAPEVQCLNENNEKVGIPLDPKLLPKLLTEPPDGETRETNKEQESSQSSDKMHDTNAEVTSVTTEKASETGIGSTCTRKETGVTAGNSFNKDMGIVKTPKLGSAHGDNFTKIIQPIARGQPSLLSNSSNTPVGLQPSRGPLSKSISFNNSNMPPKVKQLTGPLPRMQKTAKYTHGSTKREGLVKEMTRSTSLKSVSSGYPNTEPVSKIQPKLRISEDKNDVRLVRNNIEKKTFPTRDHPLVSPKPTDTTGISLPKPDFRIARSSMPDIIGTKKGSDDANNLGSRGPSSSGICILESENPCKLVLNNAPHANSTAMDITSRNPDTAVQGTTPQGVGPTHRDDKFKNPSISSSSRQTVPSGVRILRCQRCKETGHSTQNCSIDKLRITALKPSVDRNLKDRMDKSTKWKDTVEAAISKSTLQNQKSANHTEKLPVTRPDVNALVASQNRNLSPLEGSTNGLESLKNPVVGPGKTGAAADGKPQPIHRLGVSSVPRASELNSSHITSDELTAKATAQLSPDQAAVLARPLKASVIPELEFIWQGGLEVVRAGVPELCEGIQAHLSSSASSKVFDVAKKFRCRVQVNEVTRLSSWPLQFQGNSPNEDNIALFFFAKDTDSYEKKYRILLENMLQNDLALRGNVDGVELLIFPSNTLPENSQRWNRLFFLWGVFRTTRTNCTGSLPDTPEAAGGSNSTAHPLPSVISDSLSSPRINTTDNHEEELPMSDSLKVTSQLPSLSEAQVSSEMDSDAACLKNLDSAGGIYAGARSMKEHIILEGGVDLNVNPQEDVTEIDQLSWRSSLGRKRAHSSSNSSTSRASGEMTKSTCETMQCADKANQISIDGEKESKKMKLDIEGHADFSSREGSSCGKLSTKILPRSSSCLDHHVNDEIQKLDIEGHADFSSREGSSCGKLSTKILPRSSSCLDHRVNDEIQIPDSSSAQRNFFPICILSSDDEESLERNTPDLELALGCEKKPQKQDLLPLLSPIVYNRSNRDKVPGPSKNDGDDDSESLSLSLGFSGSE